MYLYCAIAKSFTAKFVYYEPLFDPQNHILPSYYEFKKCIRKIISLSEYQNVFRFRKPMIYVRQDC